MRRLGTRIVFVITVASVTLLCASVTPAGAAAADGNTRKACLSANAIESGLASFTSIDTTDRQALQAVAKRLATSNVSGAKRLAASTKKQSRSTKHADFVAATDAVITWCTQNNVLGTPTPSISTLAPTTTTTRPAISPETAEFLFKSGATTPGYDELVKNPLGSGQAVYFRGKVFQYDTNTGLTSMLVYMTPGNYDFWSDPVLVNLPSADAGNGIDNNDIVDVWGIPAGPYSYSTRAGGTNTVPKLAAKYVTLVSKG